MRCCLALSLLLFGCATAPPVDKAGLPRVGRYTNQAQLDWMLATYADVAEKAADPQVREEACLGWERTVFDLQSLRLYPVVLRMSADASALDALPDELDPAMARHPLPAVCRPVVTSASGEGAQETAAAIAAAPPPGGQGEKSAQEQSGQPEDISQPGPPEGAPAIAPTTERQLLADLRRALRLHRDTRHQRGAPDQARLLELTRSPLPPIQLRARYHLLGLCEVLVEKTDKYPTVAGTCAGGPPGEPPRRGMSRLRDDLFRAWSRKYTEPMSDIVIALANSTSRDNPLVDGPRVSR